MTKPKYSLELKKSVVMEIFKAQKSVSQICIEHGISDTLAYKWRDDAMAGIQEGLLDKRATRHLTHEAERDRLVKLIGQQAIIIEHQKKILSDPPL